MLAAEEATRQGRIVVAVGGDGTAHEVANGVLAARNQRAAMNGAYEGGGVRLAPDASLEDGLLDLYWIDPITSPHNPGQTITTPPGRRTGRASPSPPTAMGTSRYT